MGLERNNEGVHGMTSIIDNVKYCTSNSGGDIYSLGEYLELAAKDKSYYLSPAERMLKAIGEPRLVDTSTNPRLGRLFYNKVIRVYDSFADFYGMENVIERIVSYFTHSSQGLEESKQILYLLGPVGGGKSSLAEKLKQLMETQPFYAIKDSPIFDDPLSLFTKQQADQLKIDSRYIPGKMSPWLRKRVDELRGNITSLKVVKMYPNQSRRIALTKTEPGDDNNQDISTLVGKMNIRKIEEYDQNDVDSYLFSGGLCRGNRGMLEFVEMFKAPIKMLHPLLTATQEKNYNGTQEIGSIPFDGFVLAHSNESEWESFKSDKNNEAFIDRVFITEVPYCLRYSEEQKILEKLIANSSLKDAVIAPHTLEFLSKFNVLTRLSSSTPYKFKSRLELYNGECIKAKFPNSPSLQDARDSAAKDEGFIGSGTRAGFKVLAATFNYDIEEIAANPVHLIICLVDHINREKLTDDKSNKYKEYITSLKEEYKEELSKDIRRSYLDSEGEYAQNMFEQYVNHASAYIDGNDYRDPNTGHLYDLDKLNTELEKVEKPVGIANPKDFRNEIVRFVLSYRADKGKHPRWDDSETMKQAIEALLFSKLEDLLPVISFSGHKSKVDSGKHKEFINNMKAKGYTERQIRLVVDWAKKYATK
jgi:serine protein kinase